jgi:hypothetical protein
MLNRLIKCWKIIISIWKTTRRAAIHIMAFWLGIQHIYGAAFCLNDDDTLSELRPFVNAIMNGDTPPVFGLLHEHVHRRENIMGTGNADPRGSRERRAGFHCSPEKRCPYYRTSECPSIDLIIYGLEKSIRGNHERARMTFIDFLYYWHERLFKQVKRKPRPNH